MVIGMTAPKINGEEIMNTGQKVFLTLCVLTVIMTGAKK
jgi:NADH:ubiquinone oxidoreductase subunit H